MGKLKGAKSADIDAPLADVWAVVEDVATAPDWQGGMDSMDVLERDGEGRATLVETQTDAKVRTIKADVRFAYEGPNRLSWSQVKGDLKSVEGAWVLEELGPKSTRATYSLEVDTGRVIGMLIRGPVEGKVRDLLVNSRPGELKRRIEG